MDFEGFVQDLRRQEWKLHGVEVYERGQLIHAWGDTQGSLYPIYSATKSILSLAFGIAMDRGLIDPAASVLAYMPEVHLKRMKPEARERFERITLHRLLTMSVGELPFTAEGEHPLDFCLSFPILHPEKEVFHYTNISAYLVGVALGEAVGEDPAAFLRENLLAPLGIDRYRTARCRDGYFYGASGMQMTVHDLSRIGLLLCNGGTWEGKRLVPEAYIRQATSVHQMNREGGYGYFFWKYRDGFSIHGKWKQRCYILPERGLVITHLAHVEDPSSALEACMERRLLDG